MKPSKWLVLLAASALCSGVDARDALTTFAAASGAPEKRTALVVGNSGYSQGALKNPRNDARAVARELVASGFDVLLLEDGTQAGIQRAIRRFGDSLHQGGVGLFFYAGHGMQVKGRNFLVPVNADIDREYEVEFTSVDVGMVLAMMDAAKNPLNIVILDACRNNPFARSLRVAAAGLAPLDAPAGTFIAFATAPGAIANDGSGDNGVYTKHLLAHLGKPGLPIEQLFKQVRIGVMDETRNEQTPWESSSLRGEFTFRPAASVEGNAAQLVADALKREREAYRKETEALIQAALERQRREFAAPAAAPTTPADDSAVSQRTDGYRFADARGAGHVSIQEGAAYLPNLAQIHHQLRDRGRLSAIPMPGNTQCDGGLYHCTVRGRVASFETIAVPAGRFDTVKVVIEQRWQPSGVGPGVSSQVAEMWGAREITIWYSTETKLAVKASSRLKHGRHPPMEVNFELELTRVEPATSQLAARGRK